MATFNLGNGDDVLTGISEADIINGLRGDDGLDGAGGNDTINGGYGDDFLQGGEGNDSLSGQEDVDVIQGNAGNDTVDGGLDHDRVDGGVGNDSLLGQGGDDWLLAGDGNDTLLGGSGTDQLEGGAGDDSVDGSIGGDILLLGAGNDTADGGVDNDEINAGDGDDVVDGNTGSDYIVGGGGFDTLRGGNENDLIFGDGAGDRAGTPSTVSGGLITTTSPVVQIPVSGQDFAVSLTTVDATNATSIDISGLISTGAVAQDSFNVAYVIDVSGSTTSPFGGTSVGDLNGDGLSNTVLDAEIAALIALNDDIIARFGGASVDITLIAFDDVATREIVLGRADADADSDGLTDVEEALRALDAGGGTNFEAPLQQSINFFTAPATGPGNNFVFFLSDGFPNTLGLTTNETATLIADPGINATIRAVGIGTGSSLAELDLVDDNLANNSAVQVLDPAALNAALLGPPIDAATVDRLEVRLNGTLVETLGADDLVSTPFGLQYNTTVSGLSPTGNDIIRVTAFAEAPGGSTIVNASTFQTVEALQPVTNSDSIDGGTGDDELYGATGDDTVSGGIGDDSITGGAGNDLLRGSTGDDVLNGGDGVDTIRGGDGNDGIAGGRGADRLNGGNGSDTFFFNEVDQLNDTIVSFETNRDLLDVGGLLDSVGFAGTDPIADQYIRITAVASATDIRFDADGAGAGAAILIARLFNVSAASINASDFVFN